MSKLIKGIIALVRLRKSGAQICRTIVFNLRMLPFREAIHLPFILYGKVLCNECTPYESGGGIRRVSKERLKFNSWQIGYPVYHLEATNIATKLIIKGNLIVGERGRIYTGSCIIVQPNAKLQLGTGFSICTYSRLICYNDIMIGENVVVSWECQIYDTNFHYTSDVNGEVKKKDGRVAIGNNVWVANRSSLTKDSVIPSDSIVASNSLVNKDYSQNPSGLYAGIPAKLLKPSCRAEFTLEGILNHYFVINPNECSVNIKNIYKA